MLSLIMGQLTLLALRMNEALRTEAFLKQNLEREVRERTNELESERARYEELSKMDGLTRLTNKTTLLERMEHELEGFRRFRQPVAVIMIDLDHFKNINDSHGHLFGDSVLQQVAQMLLAHSRSSDEIGRFGGEEFLMLLRSTPPGEAQRHAEMLRRTLAEMPLVTEGQTVHVTGSFGVASATEEAATVDLLVRAADDAMYEAKRRGRNCTAG